MRKTTLKHPGDHLKEILSDRGLTQTDLAFILGLPSPAVVNYLINGRRVFDALISKSLGLALGLEPDYFLNEQTKYDMAMADEPDDAVSDRASLLAKYPVRELVKRGWIKNPTIEELARFLELDDADQIPYLAHAAKKTVYEEREIRPEQLVWLFRVRQIARSVVCPEYSARALTASLDRLKNMLVAPEEARHVPRIMMECGVRFVMVEALPQGKIDGVCFWLDAASPVIGMSSRFDRIDNFWFVLRHEIEHVLRKHGMDSEILDDLDGASAGTDDALPPEERVANAAAADFCVPSVKLESFLNRKHPFYYEKDVLAFAKLHGIHPGIVVGQIQHKLNRYDYLKKYQTKIRQCVLPGAIADGWGQSYPV